MPPIQLLYCCLNYLADVGIPLAQNKIPTFHIQGPLSPGRGPCFYAHPGLDAARAAWAWVLAHNSFLRPLFNAAALAGMSLLPLLVTLLFILQVTGPALLRGYYHLRQL